MHFKVYFLLKLVYMEYGMVNAIDFNHLIKLFPEPLNILHLLHRLVDLCNIYKCLMEEIVTIKIDIQSKYVNDYDTMHIVIENIENFIEIFVEEVLTKSLNICDEDLDFIRNIINRTIDKINHCIITINQNKSSRNNCISSDELNICMAFGISQVDF